MILKLFGCYSESNSLKELNRSHWFLRITKGIDEPLLKNRDTEEFKTPRVQLCQRSKGDLLTLIRDPVVSSSLDTRRLRVSCCLPSPWIIKEESDSV